MLFLLFVLTLSLSVIDAARLVFSTAASLTADHLNYKADKTQRCYSMSCFDNKAVYVSWEDLVSGGQLVFYDQVDCKGASIKGFDKKAWAIAFSTYGFKAKVSSFMIWQYSVYPLNGIVDVCEESATLLQVNSSSSSSSDEAGIIANSSST